MTRISRWPLAGLTPPRPAVQALTRPAAARADWFHLGEVRNEVVGEQTPDGDETESRSTADVYIFGAIGGWSGVTADDFVRDVAGLDVDHINMHLNSTGGGAWEGVAIANVLRQHRATVTVWVDGIAASACSSEISPVVRWIASSSRRSSAERRLKVNGPKRTMSSVRVACTRRRMVAIRSSSSRGSNGLGR